MSLLIGLFRDERRFWILAAIVGGGIAILKGLRLPNLWSATQAQVDYSFGFVKRGLLGESLNILGLSHRYLAFSLVSYLILGTMIFLVVGWSLLATKLRNTDDRLALTVFFSSYSVTYIAHLVGYLDTLLIALAILAIGLENFGMNLAPYLVAVPAVLFHESYGLLLFPTTLLSGVLKMISERDARVRRGRIFLLFAGSLVVIAASALISESRPTQMSSLLEHVDRASDFPIRTEVFQQALVGISGHIASMAELIASPRFWLNQVLAAAVFFPTLAYFLERSWKLCGLFPNTQMRRLARIATLGATGSPLTLHVLGWDVFRWDALATLSSFLTWTILRNSFAPCLLGKNHQVVLSRSRRNLAILIIMINLSSGVGLLDGYRVKAFPFDDYLEGLKSALSGRLELPSR